MRALLFFVSGRRISFALSEPRGSSTMSHVIVLGAGVTGITTAWFLRQAASTSKTWDADLASYVLFDGGFAHELIELGRRDALARASEIRRFFGTSQDTPAPPPSAIAMTNGRAA